MTYEIDWGATADVATVISIVVTALFGFYTLLKSYNLRRLELKWRKAEMAKTIIDELFQDEYADEALDIIDGTISRVADQGFDDSDVLRGLIFSEQVVMRWEAKRFA